MIILKKCARPRARAVIARQIVKSPQDAGTTKGINRYIGINLKVKCMVMVNGE